MVSTASLISNLKYAPAYLCDPALSVIISRFLHNTEAVYCADTMLLYSPLTVTIYHVPNLLLSDLRSAC